MKDTGRAIARLQLADRLEHRTYDIASGRATSIAEVIRALTTVAPEAPLELPSGPQAPDTYLDVGRPTEDTGHQPECDTARAAGDHVARLRAGNAR